VEKGLLEHRSHPSGGGAGYWLTEQGREQAKGVACELALLDSVRQRSIVRNESDLANVKAKFFTLPERHTYLVSDNYGVVAICSSEESAIETARKAHAREGFKYSTWVQRYTMDSPDDDPVEIGMFKRFPNGARQESPWIPYKAAWEYEGDIYDLPDAWIPLEN